jgi:hypothetical protein
MALRIFGPAGFTRIGTQCRATFDAFAFAPQSTFPAP